ncbi:hypothetical protein [Mucilaginibacter sp. SJ]|uniref:hypothetical protein n=1 Tax=Mucilaginibacter sp. SJ TaxID=3029053 RepID=UPI0023A9FE85|nr:hypothetical protein [Mucilaginibacter sp. SJ]WEA00717.1 hypothetical protein MusilaSJ_25005 [Mucilaginibacter sp. SJ]
MGKYFTEVHPKGLTKRINQVSKIHSGVKSFLIDDNNLKDVLIGTPDVIDKIKNKFTTDKERDSLKRLLRYDAFIKTEEEDTYNFYNGYHLAENMPIDTCVYCNRLYTHTIITDQRDLIARPTFDHWFPKSTFPLLALSFYNLIPSCNVCNSSLKGSKTMALKDIFHPYLKYPNPKKQMVFKFSYTLEDHLLAESKLDTFNKFSESSVKAMKLREIYHVHREEIRELIYLKKAYSEGYLSSLQTILKSPLTREEIYRLAFGVYLEDEQLIRRPLSKLKKDILDELGLLT